MPTPAMLLLKGVRNRDGDYEEITLSSTTPSAALKKKPCRRREAPPASNPSSGENLISGLPDECIHLVFSFLPSPRDRCSCAAVSRKWLLLLAHMRPSDFRSLKPAATAAGALSSLRKHGGDDDSTSPAAASRYLHSHKANDARLAAMAVGASARGAAPAELVIRACAATACPAPAVSSLLLSVSDMGLNVISQACPKLRSLVLWDCAQVGNEGLAAVARNCPALEKLHVSNAPLVDDGGLIFFAMSCRKLSDLSLEACPRVGDAALCALPLFSSRLESIALQNCPMVRDVSLAAVLSSLPRLAKVRIADATLGDAALEAIGSRGGANNNPVRSVCLENVTGLTHVGLRRLGMAASVQSLTVIRCCTGLTDACFDSETGFVGLKSVTLRGCTGEYFTDRGLIHLSETSKQLESLQLEKCHGITTAGLMGAVGNWSRTLRLLSVVKCDGIGTGRDGPSMYPVGSRDPTGYMHLLKWPTLSRCKHGGNQSGDPTAMYRAVPRAKTPQSPSLEAANTCNASLHRPLCTYPDIMFQKTNQTDPYIHKLSPAEQQVFNPS